MPRINLLPWREEERRTRQREFGVAAAGAVIGGVAVIMLTMLVFAQMISAQESRNNRLTAEIIQLEKSIEEIDGLERQKERLLARMEIIDRLQKSRPEVVHLFDELVRQLPDGAAGASETIGVPAPREVFVGGADLLFARALRDA